MEDWSYKRNGAVEGPISKDQLKALYDAGEITRQTLVRSSSSGGGWRRYEDVSDLRAQPRIPRAVKNLWPWFVFGTPLVGGLIDVFLIQSRGHKFVELNASWLSHAPIGVNILAIIVWLFLISIEIQKSDQKNKITRIAVWIVVAPLYQSFSWWTTALISSLINVSLGFGLPECHADLVKGQVEELFENAAAKSVDAGVGAVALTDTHLQLRTDRIRTCTGKLVTNAKTYSVRYKIEDRGTSLFRNTLHGLYVTMLIE
jgi:hypothetical protein